ncbi:ABC transporter ATP-binding protein [Paenibacillus polymyxa]|uniref:ABC transporter ATP-binding protein n=1 Tax=Paenibacillus polymyxa TaxID=1406 RepID=UPI00058A0AE0|nr:ABC transporter ATP-binding protein [Paenibacillus polymyxa]AJE54261.1 ABC transporter [Paenibacillus polymyxa]
MNVIELNNLTKQYNDVTAVDRLNLSVPEGHIYAFLGSNGAGKTTTMKMMTGQLKPTEGEIRFFGRNIWEERDARRLAGYAPDVPLLHEGLTAKEMLLFAGALYGQTQDLNGKVDAMLEQLGLQNKANQLIKEYSLGMKRKVSIGCALIHQPRILLLDEVTNGLDPKATREVKDEIRDFAKQRGGTVFLTTHILSIVEELADYIIILNKGTVKMSGTLEEMRQAKGQGDEGLEDIFLSAVD